MTLKQAIKKISERVNYKISVNAYHTYYRSRIGELKPAKTVYSELWNRTVNMYDDSEINRWIVKYRAYYPNGRSRRLDIDK